MKQTIAWIALFNLCAAQGAHADSASANSCAASLQPRARMVFDAVVANPQPQLALRSVLEARVRELVFTDRLMIGSARPAAEAASECLRISRNCSADHC
jgi:hypothetical protein